MIALTRLNGDPIEFNVFQIESVEPGADTRLTLASGRHFYVREKPEYIRAAILAWWRAAQERAPAPGAPS
jgi:uncharacterized protein YlzI (FlbEa/FlbD family)